MAKKGHGSGIQSEVIILFNAFLLKMRFPKSCFEIFPTSTFESEHFANISEAQMVFMCHLAIQYPTVFKVSHVFRTVPKNAISTIGYFHYFTFFENLKKRKKRTVRTEIGIWRRERFCALITRRACQ